MRYLKSLLITIFAFSFMSLSASATIVLDANNGGIKTFPDVSEDYIYYEAVMHLSGAGIVNGYPDGTFQPDKEVNRAEMLKILVLAVAPGQTDDYFDKSCFPDVPKGQWYTEFVCYAQSNDWIKGYTDGTFRPEQTITFVEALKITFKAFGLAYNEDQDPWYRMAVQWAGDHNYIPFSVSAFQEPVTRGVMSDLTTRIKIDSQQGGVTFAEYLGDRSKIVVTYETLEAGLNLAFMVPAEAQSCPQGTQLYRDEIDKFEFCYTEDGLIHKSDFYGTTISFSPDPDLSEEDPLDGSISTYLSYGLNAAGYLEISEFTEPQNAENFTNYNDINGVEYDIVDGDLMSHNLIFGDKYKTKVIKINYNFAEEADIELMQTIKETFKFL